MTRYKACVLFLFIIGICTFSFVEAEQNPLPLFGKVIYIDPGHGGTDPGAIYKEIYESDINLEISKKIEDVLRSYGAIVYLTRYGDYDLAVPHALNRKRSDLSRRGNIINRSMCDMYISIHLNAETSSTWYGAQVFYDDVNPDNKAIAETMQKVLSSNLRTRRKISETSEMYLHRRVERPGVLIEAGFLTNPNERYLLRQEWYQKKLAKVISDGILQYFQNSQIKIGV
jgi:N-acetylmuramoyl-L-alanine amidase